MKLEEIMNLIFPFFKEKEREEAEELALQAQNNLLQLNGLTPIDNNDENETSLIDSLNHICLLSDRLLEQKRNQNIDYKPKDSKNKKTETTPKSSVKIEEKTITETIINPLEEISIIKESFAPSEIEQPLITENKIESIEKKPSAIAQELIKLRDWVLVASSSEENQSADRKALQILDQKLGKILEKEGITTVEDTGHCNYDRHKIVSTEITNDSTQDEIIYQTVRPGYIFDGSLIRPQEVIIYSYEN